MNIKITDNKTTKEYSFREGTLASEAICSLGFDFPMPCGGMGRCGKCKCIINGKEALACKSLLFSDSLIEIPISEQTVLTADREVKNADGIVIDIGTTTVAAAVFENGMPVKTFGVRNPQCSYGADVISRIGIKDFAPLTDSINSLIDGIRSRWGMDIPAVIVGNTAMLTIFAGINPKDLGVYPFTPPSLFDCHIKGAYIPPCAGAFIGADALCSLLRSGAADKNETALVMDLGTNGEIALVHNGRITFTSAAAGPALEGGNIKYGMSAGEGAINHVNISSYSVIKNTAPKGICGSGLIDAAALMLKNGIITKEGFLKSPFEIHDSKIYITGEDIRAFQLCKGAISAAVKLLLKSEGLSEKDIDRVYLSGALGESITLENAVYTGLLPKVPTEKYTSLGNGALLGGAMALTEENRLKLRTVAQKTKVLNSGTDEAFARLFIEEMNFK